MSFAQICVAGQDLVELGFLFVESWSKSGLDDSRWAIKKRAEVLCPPVEVALFIHTYIHTHSLYTHARLHIQTLISCPRFSPSLQETDTHSHEVKILTHLNTLRHATSTPSPPPPPHRTHEPTSCKDAHDACRFCSIVDPSNSPLLFPQNRSGVGLMHIRLQRSCCCL